MGFWPGIAAQVIAGSIIALVVATLAVLVTNRYAARRAEAQAHRERDMAAAAEFYRTHGAFFAVWKAWEFHSLPERDGSGPVPPTQQRRAELIEKAAIVEGAYESLIVRIALEHDLHADEAAALWSLRFAFKQLRRSMRAGTVLAWWRDGNPADLGNREYRAFKALVAMVANILTGSNRKPPPAEPRDRAAVLSEITGTGTAFTDDARFVDLITIEQERRSNPQETSRTGWEWLVIAEHVAVRGAFRQEE